jgi:hypothetical protein
VTQIQRAQEQSNRENFNTDLMIDSNEAGKAPGSKPANKQQIGPGANQQIFTKTSSRRSPGLGLGWESGV